MSKELENVHEILFLDQQFSLLVEIVTFTSNNEFLMVDRRAFFKLSAAAAIAYPDRAKGKPNMSIGNILVFGTSNAVMQDGYVQYLRNNPLVARCDNYSIGFSGSASYVYFIDKINLSDYNYCIIDYFVNEVLMLGGKWSNSNRVKSQLESLCARLSQAGCIPIFLVLPSKSSFNNYRSFVWDIIENISENYRIPVFNSYAFLEAYLSHAPRLTLDELFIDNSHIKLPVASLIANTLVTSLSAIKPIKPILGPIVKSRYDFLSIQMLLPENETILFSNSYLSLTAAYIPPKGIDVAPDGAKSIVGVAFNLSQTGCNIMLSGTSNEACRCFFDTYYKGDRKSVMLSVLPVNNGGIDFNNAMIFMRNEEQEKSACLAGIIIEKETAIQSQLYFDPETVPILNEGDVQWPH